MRRPILNTAVLVIVLTLTLSSVAVLPVTSQDKEEIKSKLEDLRLMVEKEHPCLENKVNAVIHQIEAEAYNGALNKLVNDVNKTISAWVKNPDELYRKLNEIVELIKGIIHPTPDFEIFAKPEELEIMQNSSDTSTITVKSLHGFSQRINLSAELTPLTDKVTLTLDPTWVIPTPKGNTSTLTVAVDIEAEEGEYVITVTGTNGTLQRSVNITLEVESVPTPPFKDFTIEASPDSLTIQQGGSNTSIITVTSLKGFSRSVDLSITSPSIDGVNTTLSPSTVIPPPNKYAFSLLTVDVVSTATIGNYTLTVTGTSHDRIHSANVTLQVTSAPTPPVPDFSLAASPPSLTIPQGASDEVIIIVASLEGFSKAVALEVASESIEGVELSLDPGEVTPPADGFATSTLTIEVASDAEVGEHVITVSGTCGVVERSVDIIFVVEAVPSPPHKDFTIAASPASLVIPQGGSNTSIITITSLDGFSEPVDLTIASESILGVSATLNPSQVAPLPNKSAISILTIDVASTATSDSYIITVKGKSGSLCHSADVVLEVTAPLVPLPPTPDFSIAASPTSLSIEQGASDKSTIIITSLKGFKETVVLEVTSKSIEGIELTLDPSEVTLPENGFATSTLTIEVELDASPSEHSITIGGTSDALTHSVTVSLKVVVEKTPPVIVSVMKQPEKPSYNETVTVLASVTDAGSGVKDVILSYSRGTKWENKTMTLKEGLYKATVPAFPFNTMVNYRVYAFDKVGNKATPTSVYSYVVADPYPPVIGEPSWAPEEPAADEEITVNVTVTEPVDGSGVEEVVLWYSNKTLEEEWQSTPMTLNGGNWTAKIANQSDTVVTFFIEAFDKAENRAESQEQEFTVAAPAGFPLAWVLAAIAAVGAGSGGGVYYWRRRRKKTHGTSALTTPTPT